MVQILRQAQDDVLFYAFSAYQMGVISFANRRLPKPAELKRVSRDALFQA